MIDDRQVSRWQTRAEREAVLTRGHLRRPSDATPFNRAVTDHNTEEELCFVVASSIASEQHEKERKKTSAGPKTLNGAVHSRPGIV